MGSSRKSHTEKAGKAKAVKPRSLAKREMGAGEAKAVRGGYAAKSSFMKNLDKTTPVILQAPPKGGS